MKSSKLLFSLTMIIISLVHTNCEKPIVKPPPPVVMNQPPVIDGGPDKTMDIPTNSTQLDLNVSDPDLNLISVRAKKISGPKAGNFRVEKDWRFATVSLLEEGDYELELTATDYRGLMDKDTVRITVTSNLRKHIIHSLVVDNSFVATVEIPEPVYQNFKWVYCRSSEYCMGAGPKPAGDIDYSWGGRYYQLLPGNNLSVFGGSTNEKFDLVIYY